MIRVLNAFLDNRLGGPQQRGMAIARELVDKGTKTIMLFNEKDRIDHSFYEGVSSYTLKHMQMLTNQHALRNGILFFLWLPYTVWRLLRIISVERIDVIHVNGIMNILPALVGRVGKAKIVWHLNDVKTGTSSSGSFCPWSDGSLRRYWWLQKRLANTTLVRRGAM